MEAYTWRCRFMWLFRKLVYLSAEVIRRVPGTTFGEVASMHRGPCQRCVGRALAFEPVAEWNGEVFDTMSEVAAAGGWVKRD